MISHEIGHIILHSNKTDSAKSTFQKNLVSMYNRKIDGCNDESDENRDAIEIQADKFAAYLLMPKKSIKKIFFKSYYRPVDVSRRKLIEFIFPKSKKSKAYRIINKIQSTGAFKDVSKMALLNRLIGLKLIKGIEFQKNNIKEY